jgi:hypothetical protein
MKETETPHEAIVCKYRALQQIYLKSRICDNLDYKKRRRHFLAHFEEWLSNFISDEQLSVNELQQLIADYTRIQSSWYPLGWIASFVFGAIIVFYTLLNLGYLTEPNLNRMFSVMFVIFLFTIYRSWQGINSRIMYQEIIDYLEGNLKEFCDDTWLDKLEESLNCSSLN